MRQRQREDLVGPTCRVGAVLGRTLRLPGPFARLSATPLAPPRRPPEAGEHNHAVYVGLCGFAERDLDALRRDGAI